MCYILKDATSQQMSWSDSNNLSTSPCAMFPELIQSGQSWNLIYYKELYIHTSTIVNTGDMNLRKVEGAVDGGWR